MKKVTSLLFPVFILSGVSLVLPNLAFATPTCDMQIHTLVDPQVTLVPEGQDTHAKVHHTVTWQAGAYCVGPFLMTGVPDSPKTVEPSGKIEWDTNAPTFEEMQEMDYTQKFLDTHPGPYTQNAEATQRQDYADQFHGLYTSGDAIALSDSAGSKQTDTVPMCYRLVKKAYIKCDPNQLKEQKPPITAKYENYLDPDQGLLARIDSDPHVTLTNNNYFGLKYVDSVSLQYNPDFVKQVKDAQHFDPTGKPMNIFSIFDIHIKLKPGTVIDPLLGDNPGYACPGFYISTTDKDGKPLVFLEETAVRYECHIQSADSASGKAANDFANYVYDYNQNWSLQHPGDTTGSGHIVGLSLAFAGPYGLSSPNGKIGWDYRRNLGHGDELVIPNIDLASDWLLTEDRKKAVIDSIAAGRPVVVSITNSGLGIDVPAADKRKDAPIAMSNCMQVEGEGKIKIVAERDVDYPSSTVFLSGLNDYTAYMFRHSPFKENKEKFSVFIDLHPAVNASTGGASIRDFKHSKIESCTGAAITAVFEPYTKMFANGESNMNGDFIVIDPITDNNQPGVHHEPHSTDHDFVHEVGHAFGTLDDESRGASPTSPQNIRYFLDRNCSDNPTRDFSDGRLLYSLTDVSGCGGLGTTLAGIKAGEKPVSIFVPHTTSNFFSMMAYNEPQGRWVKIGPRQYRNWNQQDEENQQFNVPSCGWIMKGIKGGKASDYFAECAQMVGVTPLPLQTN